MKYILAIICCAVFLSIFVNQVFAKDKTGIIVVDVQGDFTILKKGSLAVPGTDKTFIQ